MDPTVSLAAGAEPVAGEKRKATALEGENASKALKTAASFASPGLLTPSPDARSASQQTLLSPSVSSYTPPPLCSPTAAFVAGAAAVTSVLSAPLLEKSQNLLGDAAATSSLGSNAGAPQGTGEHAVDVARAAAAAAAAVSARQAAANSAAKALQMALKTAELIQGPPGTPGGAAAAGADLSAQSRHARKVYVGNLPVPVTQAEVQQYFNELLTTLLPKKVPGDTIVHVYVNPSRRFAFLEHRSIEEANFTLGLDGVSWRNCALSLRRPQDYNPTLAEQQYREERARLGSMTGFAVPPPSQAATPASPAESSLIAGALGIVSTTVPDSPHKIFIGGLPHSITEQGCKQLLEAFGQLRALHVVKDQQRGDCKGFAFCEYLDPNVTDVAVAGLNNMRIADRVLQVRRAMPHGQMKAGADGSAAGSPAPAAPSIVGEVGERLPAKSATITLSKVIAIHNMLPPLPLVPVLLREAAASEARMRASPYGEILFIDVLEHLATSAAAKGEGVPVLVEFRDVDSAIQAMSGIQGSTYDGRSLSVVFAEPSAAMKKAAVLRIIQEAGGSTAVPVKTRPSASGVTTPKDSSEAQEVKREQVSSGAGRAEESGKNATPVPASEHVSRSPAEAAAAGSAAVAAFLFGSGSPAAGLAVASSQQNGQANGQSESESKPQSGRSPQIEGSHGQRTSETEDVQEKTATAGTEVQQDTDTNSGSGTGGGAAAGDTKGEEKHG
ncbi:RNA recognition motif-containing protein [Toxoplasma gondii RUB]|uniref:RNA recognition motif-containing protein n=7 Tax=Toxoplasma gondii TaxID=5811 RepID=S7UPP3_TOXGG|nr:RNA recognition motif-containing protein [Toxoplasma gondii GT1]KFG42159.1 RNA recognition motif-containing protein [Toxoplasma gondii GAB2-2007-GAL-DOM2]KFG62896.1 RNA recognition motif-containing protein [Toxoplasma gondii RUB]KFH05870.1 RNA recognition motif-containing protein [Toxoplasma gondii MAS]KFH12657.1 RNA recognition motif-containing protein [Toxoplasma gondii VAND]PUA90354.1 RNA recognition motif-containing protein [Toxoplasma gondii TgCATBr9]RQX73575.1 RNA recognition motif-c